MDHADPRPIPVPFRAFRAAVRGLAIVGVWVTAVGVAVAAFPAGSRGVREAIPFGLSFAIASALAGVVALAVGGRRLLAIEVAVVLVVAIGIPAAAGAGLLWLAPSAAKWIFGLGSWDLLSYRRWLVASPGRLLATAGLAASAPVLGPVVGTFAGLLARLGRRRPGLAAALGAGMLVAVGAAASPAARLVADSVLEVRDEHGRYRAGQILPMEVDGTIGAVAGSIIGAILACGATRGRGAAVAPSERPA